MPTVADGLPGFSSERTGTSCVQNRADKDVFPQIYSFLLPAASTSPLLKTLLPRASMVRYTSFWHQKFQFPCTSIKVLLIKHMYKHIHNKEVQSFKWKYNEVFSYFPQREKQALNNFKWDQTSECQIVCFSKPEVAAVVALQWAVFRKVPLSTFLPIRKVGKFIPLQSLKYPASKPNHTHEGGGGQGGWMSLFILSAWYLFSTGDFQRDDNLLPAQFNHQRFITSTS